jgi:hypothetical protein
MMSSAMMVAIIAVVSSLIVTTGSGITRAV